MIRWILFSILFLLSLSFFAQNKEIDSLLVVLKTAKEDTNKVNLLNLLSEKARRQVDKYGVALQYAQQAETLAKKMNFQKGIGSSYYNMGVVYDQQGKETESLECYQKSAKIYEEVGNKKGLANSYNRIGTIYIHQSNHIQAVKVQIKSLEIFEEINDKIGIASSCNNMGIINQDQGNYAQALQFYQKSLKICEEIGNKKGEAGIYNNMGSINQDQGNYIQALEFYQKSFRIYEEIGNKQGSANLSNNIGNSYRRLGNLALSLEFHRKSLKLREEIGDKRGLAMSCNNMGINYSSMGNYIQALESYQKSLKIYEEIGNNIGIAASYNNIGIIYEEQVNYEQAIEFYQKALKIREEMGDKKGMAEAYINMGVIYLCLSNHIQALTFSKKALRIFEEIGNKDEMASSYINIARVYKTQGNYDSAYNVGSKALSIANEINNQETKLDCNRYMFKLSTATNSMQISNRYLDEIVTLRNRDLLLNFSVLSEHEKELYFTTIQQDFELQYDFALHHAEIRYQLDSVYNNVLLTKGLTLRSSTAMRTSILSSGDTLLVREYDEWLVLKRQISKNYEAGKDVSELETKANELERELVKKSNVFSDFDKAKNLDWKQVQASLKPKEAAIEFVHFKSEIDTLHPIKYAALIIKPESKHPEIISLCDENDLVKILGAFQGNNLNYVNGIYGTKKDASLALYDKVWKPMENSLQGISTIYYSPSGLLHKISFSALNSGKNVYLCDKYNLNRESSTGKVALPDNINYLPSDKIALIGGVKYNSDTTKKEMWNYLPGTLTEAEEINKLLKTKKHNVNYLASVNANETNFKKDIPQVEILHVATHGFFFPDPEKVKEELKVTETKEKNLTFRGTTDYANWSFVNNKNPLMRSGIVLAGANDVWERDPFAEGEDGVLTAQEVSNMDMRKTKLVVLSACETGLGDIKGSEGVYGLQRAFKIAGVNYIVMSLWQVPDKETSEFMINFYKKLTTQKDIKKAFHSTQKEMRKKYDPYYWAAFVLVE